MPIERRPSSFDGIKRTAKEISRKNGITHAEALDAAAKLAGFQNFAHARKAFSANSHPTETRSGYQPPPPAAPGGMLAGLMSYILGFAPGENRLSFAGRKSLALALTGCLLAVLSATAAMPFPNGHQIHAVGNQAPHQMAQIVTLPADSGSGWGKLLRHLERDEA